jgi:hypothetical protein
VFVAAKEGGGYDSVWRCSTPQVPKEDGGCASNLVMDVTAAAASIRGRKARCVKFRGRFVRHKLVTRVCVG